MENMENGGALADVPAIEPPADPATHAHVDALLDYASNELGIAGVTEQQQAVLRDLLCVCCPLWIFAVNKLRHNSCCTRNTLSAVFFLTLPHS